MGNLRYLLRLISAFFSRFRGIIIIGVLLGIGIFFIISLIVPVLGQRGVERIGVTGRFTTTSLPESILKEIGNGLTKISPSGDVTPDLASSWESTDKGKTWTFILKDNLTWQDGKKVDSGSINYQFSDLAIERPDSKTLVFKLQNAYSPFPAVVAKTVFKKGLLGTGEWSVKRISLSGGYVSQLILQNKNKNRKVYKFYPTEERAKLAFKLGEVDRVLDLINPAPLDSWGGVEVVKEKEMGEYVALFFNTQDRLLSEKTLRQALAYAIKKEDLPGERALSPISPDSWAYNPQVKPYNYDSGKAKSTISDLPRETREDLTIDLTTSPILLPTAEKIAKNWEEVGIKTNIQVLSSIPSEYQALLAIFDIPEDPDQYSIWHSTQTETNVTKYQNPRIDKLLETGRTELNIEERKKIYLDFQRFLVEDSPVVFLYFPETYTIKRK